MFSSGPSGFTAKQVLDQIGTYVNRIYGFFRWAVTDDFLKLYGGLL